MITPPQKSVNMSVNIWTFASKQAALKILFNLGKLCNIRAMWNSYIIAQSHSESHEIKYKSRPS